jgi:hypothetical protein
VKALRETDGGWHLIFEDKSEALHDRVILALPAKPLADIVDNSLDDFQKIEPDIGELVSSAFGFPMVKVFAVVDRVFWKDAQQANELATSMPTRELHYWRGLTGTNRGMMMAYTDRPATSFWANYVAPGPQQDATTYAREDKTTRLKMKVLNFIRLGGGAKVNADDIAWYGIRDWGRDPYGAANHAWRPERRYWVVMRRLAQLGKDDSKHMLHVCGEAFSDYHGFMEGSLRSAVYSLHRMFRSRGDDELEWLAEVLPISETHFAELKSWVDRLDKVPSNAEFVIREEAN